jgi:hypothetical protein
MTLKKLFHFFHAFGFVVGRIQVFRNDVQVIMGGGEFRLLKVWNLVRVKWMSSGSRSLVLEVGLVGVVWIIVKRRQRGSLGLGLKIVERLELGAAAKNRWV